MNLRSYIKETYGPRRMARIMASLRGRQAQLSTSKDPKVREKARRKISDTELKGLAVGADHAAERTMADVARSMLKLPRQ